MNVKDIIEKLQEIQNSFLGYEPGTGYADAPGPHIAARIARAVHAIECIKRELAPHASNQPADPDAAGAGSK
jgi:hypothetical protein